MSVIAGVCEGTGTDLPLQAGIATSVSKRKELKNHPNCLLFIVGYSFFIVATVKDLLKYVVRCLPDFFLFTQAMAIHIHEHLAELPHPLDAAPSDERSIAAW